MSTCPFDERRLERAWQLLAAWVAEDRTRAAAGVVGGSDWQSEVSAHGRLRDGDDAPPIEHDTIFLMASPSKPVSALAVMLLAERGLVRLNDPIQRYVPEFHGGGKRKITLRNCLTHTSGLPDMLPNNNELREQHAPLADFVRGTCGVELLFKPGTETRYQSMGLLMLGEVVRVVSGKRLGEFLRDEVFLPLQMHDTVLGMTDDWHEPDASGRRRVDRIAEVRVAADKPAMWQLWNSEYWRRQGAPWGGLLSTCGDWARLCRHLLGIHRGQAGVISPTTLAAMTANQLEYFAELPEDRRRTQPWGFGWQLNWPAHPTTFGDFLSPRSYGHWGMVGTLVWLDPVLDLFGVALTTEPLDDRRYHSEWTNAVTGAVR
ncbi:MAG: serine hydrolase domain-containing protein [Pirellulales bacterium]|nr:beta-lactamase family protein [Planctomycetales bacterium]